MRAAAAALVATLVVGGALPATATTPLAEPDVVQGSPLFPELATGATIAASIRDLILTVESTQDSSVDVTTPSERQLTLAADVLFAFGKADLAPAATARLAEVVASAKEGEIVSVSIEGYTDSVGDQAANVTLSRQRAEAVLAALAPQLPGVRFTVTGKGEAQPVVPNTNKDGSDNPAGRAKNRRVVITVER